MRKKTEEKRQSLIDAALEVFREVGFDQASMAQIAARSGASKATLYGYFTSKEEMFAEVLCRQAAKQVSESFGQLRLDIPLRDSLIAFGKQFLPAMLNPEILAVRRLAIQEGERSDLGRSFYELGPKRGWALLKDFLAAAMESGFLREGDPGAAAFHLKALYEAESIELAILGYPVSRSPARVLTVVTRAVDVFLAGYGTRTN
ncbi:TetR/AcrR family transcriptional regulator [Cupriavidus basilensis]